MTRPTEVESVWDYPRPPIVVPFPGRITVTFAGRVVADSRRTSRVLETSHPPVFYIPMTDLAPDVVERARGAVSWCEWKGQAEYWDLRVGDRRSQRAAWSYPLPSPGFEAIAGHLAFYPSRTDACTVDGELVTAQSGDFYGGWITSAIRGPYKGGPGTAGW
jgi:uncharacterized protein (DUF427 family)